MIEYLAEILGVSESYLTSDAAVTMMIAITVTFVYLIGKGLYMWVSALFNRY